MDKQAQLEQEIEKHNELHTNIQTGEQQLVLMKEEKQRLVGRIQLLQEILQEDEGEVAPSDIASLPDAA